jgi:pimeloyl-ACP methyl ester carboxylesterase
VSCDSSTFQLQDGRTLGFAEYGARSGNVLFYFHGYPGSRVEAALLSGPAERHGVRIIGIDRPGMGRSTFIAGRRFLDWPTDVTALADKLGIDQFSVAGVSGGGPYAIACAYKIPNRLIACGIVAGAGVAGRFLSLLSSWLPWVLTPMVRPCFRTKGRAARSICLLARRWPEPDRQAILRSTIGDVLAASLAEAFRQGSKGPAYEAVLLGGSWGFKLEDVSFSNSYLWHGGLDRQVPIAIGRAVAVGLRDCKATFYPQEGHISVIARHGDDIIQTLGQP